MSSQADNDASRDTTPATGNSRRWPARQIAVCAAIVVGTFGSGMAGWVLRSVLFAPAETVASSEHAPDSDAPFQASGHRAPDEALEDELHASNLLEDAGPSQTSETDRLTSSSETAAHPGDPYSDTSLVESHALPNDPLNVAGGPRAAGDDYRTPDALIPSAEELDRAASLGESYMFEGDAARALRLFDWLLEHQDRSRDDRFHYRCGLCAEAVGELNRSLQEYGTALAAAHDATIIALCRLGQARAWRSLGNHEMATQLLAAAWLTNGREGHAEVVRSFNAYLLADALAAEILGVEPSRLTEDRTYLFPTWEFDLFERTLLSSIRQEASEQTPIRGGVRVLSTSTSADGTPEVVLQINLPRMGVVNVVEALCRAAECRVVWSSSARLATHGRSSEVCQAHAALPLCLDAITAPLGIVWTRRNREFRMSTVDEVTAATIADGRHDAARRALEHAVRQHPDFVLAPHALVALGNIELRDGRGDDAMRLYQEVLENYPTDPVRSAAWFNLAKLHLGREHTDAALDAFWHVVDSGGAPDEASVAYLYIGRLLLDAEQPRRAITPLIRATKWAPGSAVRTKSVLCLAAAYLLYGNPKGANEVLMDFRGDAGSQATEAAFLSALARYRVADNPSRRFLEGQALLAAVDPVKPQEFFGRYGWYLCGNAYEELLLPENAAGVYQQAFDVYERPTYHDAIAFGLARCLAETGDVDAARRHLSDLIENAAPDWQRRAAFRLCRLQLDSKRPQAAAQTAHTLLKSCSEHADKARALRLLGESFQRLGDHAAAALCFAGSVPDHPPPAETVQH